MSDPIGQGFAEVQKAAGSRAMVWLPRVDIFFLGNILAGEIFWREREEN
jgi:hypothetical protein